MDGSLSRMRGKADFRLMRELLGLPQEWVAKRAGVDARTVRNWESPRYFYPPKREAWDLVEGLLRPAAFASPRLHRPSTRSHASRFGG